MMWLMLMQMSVCLSQKENIQQHKKPRSFFSHAMPKSTFPCLSVLLSVPTNQNNSPVQMPCSQSSVSAVSATLHPPRHFHVSFPNHPSSEKKKEEQFQFQNGKWGIIFENPSRILPFSALLCVALHASRTAVSCGYLVSQSARTIPLGTRHQRRVQKNEVAVHELQRCQGGKQAPTPTTPKVKKAKGRQRQHEGEGKNRQAGILEWKNTVLGMEKKKKEQKQQKKEQNKARQPGKGTRSTSARKAEGEKGIKNVGSVKRVLKTAGCRVGVVSCVVLSLVRCKGRRGCAQMPCRAWKSLSAWVVTEVTLKLTAAAVGTPGAAPIPPFF
ncbi:hypothetical protein B0T16DRAFT_69315 [Cercophora newfieldiana]|uniref:Uncharacterized protein n=1 Tax=Cercophora newfieldiana TaxID=92897 RepID=A0AA39YSJ9_9PEZI|nr:hypothetical protein B0T16DRAFT_69315 [Cercophora newfieldiana]